MNILSKYTTEVRFICESLAGYEESVGFKDVDTVLKNSYLKIFTTNAVFYKPERKEEILTKLLKHYYTREICEETFGLWQLRVNTKLEEILPYYNELYKSAELEFDPFNDVNLTREHTLDREDKSNSDDKGKSSSESKDLYSDTPQGSIENLESGTYLTNARIINGVNSVDNSTNTESTGKETYKETVTGKQGTENYSKLLEQYRSTILNIDMLLINEFEDLFFGLW